ncbi:hypothetical protein [Mesorhizobium australicum]|uniref:DUF1772 domain-containing protein n=1 Tax=Mesorhizobium australicum TaxID=536018 RepID=A0A1X7N110_9HYPH|nr:hypothetical protein [Mesorhizobium australicum]SMH30037.1 hypothetical protein SAMN02982922_0985 [Mesorhizobium australicum]
MILKLLTLALTTLTVIPGGAHLFELPAKIGMTEAEYFTAQSIYAGWALFGVAIFAAIAANGFLSWTLRRKDRVAARSALASALLICLTLVVFFIWVFPGNQATSNWTSIPGNWEDLRRNWEYGHAVNAVITFIALLATGRAIIGKAAT